MGSDPQHAKWPLMSLSQQVFVITNPYASRQNQESAVKSLQDAITEHKMAPFYRYLAHPVEGVVSNFGGSQTPGGPGKPLSRKSSLVGMIATKGPVTNVTLPWDEALYEKLKAENDKELEEIQKEEDEAVEQAGDTEILAARGKRAEFWARVGDKVRHRGTIPIFLSPALQPSSASLLTIRRIVPSVPTKTSSKRRGLSAPRSTSFSR